MKRRTKAWYVFLAILAATTAPSGLAGPPAQNAAKNGLWPTMDDSAKYGYILGFSNATEFYQMVLRGTCFQVPSNPAPCSQATKQNIGELIEAHPIYGAKTLGAWKDGMDKFYTDPRNRGVDLISAMQIVGMELAGYPATEVDKQVRQARGEK